MTVTVSPALVTLATKAQQMFQCTVTGSPDGVCTWSVAEGAPGGSISALGSYQAPMIAGTYHVVATSRAAPTKSATATVQVSMPAAGTPGVWTKMLNWPTSQVVMSGDGLVGDPARPSDFYFFYETGTPNSNADRHVLKSTDFGLTWTKVNQTMARGNAWGIAIDPNPNRNPATPPTMYTPAGYGDLGLWKSTDGAVTWTNLIPDNGIVPKKGGGTVQFPPGKSDLRTDFYQVHILPDNSPNHILVTYHYGSATHQALGESTDGGLTWEVHNTPWGDSHYIYAVDATTWLLIAGWGGPGIYRTTTAGRVNGQISEAAWTQVGNFTHHHGSFTPWRDPTSGALYFPVNGTFPIQGVRRSIDKGATWTVVYDKANVGAVVGTANTLYVFPFGSTNVLKAPLSNPSMLTPLDPAPGGDYDGVIPPYGLAASFDGQRSVILAAMYWQRTNGVLTANGEIWRYVEP